MGIGDRATPRFNIGRILKLGCHSPLDKQRMEENLCQHLVWGRSEDDIWADFCRDRRKPS